MNKRLGFRKIQLFSDIIKNLISVTFSTFLNVFIQRSKLIHQCSSGTKKNFPQNRVVNINILYSWCIKREENKNEHISQSCSEYYQGEKRNTRFGQFLLQNFKFFTLVIISQYVSFLENLKKHRTLLSQLLFFLIYFKTLE